MKYDFRRPGTKEEFEEIFRLNYRVFVEELRQYQPRTDGRLVDKFHSRNQYFIAVHDGAIAGMIAVHDERPFSVEQRLGDLRVLDSLPRPQLEVRLLAIHPAHRNHMVAGGLFQSVYHFATERGYGTLLMSGVTGRLELYRKLGFRDLGPPVPYGEVEFVPMAVRLADVPERLAVRAEQFRRRRS